MSIKNGLIELEDSFDRLSTLTLKLNYEQPFELFVENCRGVLHCDENFITLHVYGANVRVSGSPLVLNTFGAEGVKISGDIQALNFEACNEK